MLTGDTIVAISSAVGAAARMMVRASGGEALKLAAALGADGGAEPGAARTTLRLNGMEVPAWVYRFWAPRSYTGEDLVEFHVPGNPLLARMLLADLIKRGARAAEAGEFTARAYFNGRMDLAEAEGVAATIAAHGERELGAARQLLNGELSRRLAPMMEELAQTLALVEAGIDFSGEDLTFLSADELLERVRKTDRALEELVSRSARFERLAHEPQFVLVGRPSAGKSTLLNALAGSARAVVSPHPGTTRDVIWAEVALQRGIVRLVDAAGLEENPPRADDASPAAPIARQMHEHALGAVKTADCVILVHDVCDPRPRLALPRRADLMVLSKLDLAAKEPHCDERQLAISAQSGANMEKLRVWMDEMAFGASSAMSPVLALNARHLQAIAESREALRRAEQAAPGAGAEIVAFELREALDALGRILGRVSPDDLLGRVFSSFCIGK